MAGAIERNRQAALARKVAKQLAVSSNSTSGTRLSESQRQKIEANKATARSKKAAIEAKKAEEKASALAEAALQSSRPEKRRSSLDEDEDEYQIDPVNDHCDHMHEDKKRKTDGKEKEKGQRKRKNVDHIHEGIREAIRKAKDEAAENWKKHRSTSVSGAYNAPPMKTVHEQAPRIKTAGFDAIHHSHKRVSLNGEIIFCWNCGYWMLKKTQKLQERCDAGQISSHQRSTRDDKLRKGFYPQAKGGPIKNWKNGLSTAVAAKHVFLDAA